ncbi:hypothetical protein BQ8482_60129 [Mesorhizobium delmotii]|uniref:Uncharacterized protein n=1 Tax=Mesorhizobium delmotii TaxID=1631247 RepID=A0A2P9AVF2_9HYPH|nr:hypothetical protein BQ8482_60129 [Mesorhizobium delmotii]
MSGGFQMGGLMRGDGAQYESPRALLIAKKTARASPSAFRSPELVDTFGGTHPGWGKACRLSFAGELESAADRIAAMSRGGSADHPAPRRIDAQKRCRRARWSPRRRTL